jgi:hypothetical protein
MRINGWECTANHDGSVRVAKHSTEGTMAWVGGRIIGEGAVPAEVVAWLMRARYRQLWSAAFDQGVAYEILKGVEGILRMTQRPSNPYDGELPDKDNEPS